MNRQQRRLQKKNKAKTSVFAQNPQHFLNNLNSLQTQTEIGQAEKLLKKALIDNPDNAQYWLALAQLCRLKGDHKNAENWFRKAVEAQPDFTEAHKDLAYTKKFTDADDPDLARLQALETRADALPLLQQSQLFFALGKAYQDLKNYDPAFEKFKHANTALRDTYSYDISGLEDYYKEIARICDAAFIADHNGAGCTSEQPVFVVGMPRSGTTLAEQILSSHAQAHGAGELKVFDQIISQMQQGKQDSLFNQAFFDSLNSEKLSQIGTAYTQATEKLGLGAMRIVDKMPFNYMWIGLIKLALPNAKIIHCIREPRDIAVSCYTRMFTELTPWSNDLAEIGKFYNAYQKLMTHWKSLFGDEIYDLDYAALVENPETEIRKLLDYCEMPWQEDCLNFHKTRRVVATASDTQVRQPLYKTAIDRWTVYKDHLQPLEDILETS